MCGPIEIPSIGGSKCFINFIDNFLRKIWLYFMKKTSEVFNIFKSFKAYIERDIGKKLKS
jgi:hypothetical protein